MEGIEAHLKEAAAAIYKRRRLFSGAAALERAWANLRAADTALVSICSDEDLVGRSVDVLRKVEYHIKKDDPLRVEVENTVRRIAQEGVRAGDRNLLVLALDASYEALDAEYSRVRSLSGILRIATFFVLIGAGGLAAWGWFCPHSLNMCSLPQGASFAACPSGDFTRRLGEPPSYYAKRIDVLVVEAAGLTGAALTVIASLRQIHGTSSPYMLPLSAALLKFPTGALTAFAGVLFINGAFIPGLSELDTSSQIVAWAISFGAAQHLVTRFVDQRARETLSDVGRPPSDSDSAASKA
ncbi:hypothetical protein [Streptomyces sp. NPDC054783]